MCRKGFFVVALIQDASMTPTGEKILLIWAKRNGCVCSGIIKDQNRAKYQMRQLCVDSPLFLYDVCFVPAIFYFYFFTHPQLVDTSRCLNIFWNIGIFGCGFVNNKDNPETFIGLLYKHIMIFKCIPTFVLLTIFFVLWNVIVKYMIF